MFCCVVVSGPRQHEKLSREPVYLLALDRERDRCSSVKLFWLPGCGTGSGNPDTDARVCVGWGSAKKVYPRCRPETLVLRFFFFFFVILSEVASLATTDKIKYHR